MLFQQEERQLIYLSYCQKRYNNFVYLGQNWLREKKFIIVFNARVLIKKKKPDTCLG